MSTTRTATASPTTLAPAPLEAPRTASSILDFNLGYVADKLLDSGVSRTRAEADALLLELKKYLFLSHLSGQPLPMCSALVDAAWHQFLLFTRQYEHFCITHLGGFMHHTPARPGEDAEYQPSWEHYVELYESHFGELPGLWLDWECLRPDTRLQRVEGAEGLRVRHEPPHALLVADACRARAEEPGPPRLSGLVVCRANARARSALEFIATQRSFLIRELPGLRSEHECLTLARPLVRHNILRVAL